VSSLDRDWSRRLESWREERDRHFAEDIDSPIPDEEKKSGFTGLHYFAPDEKLVFQVQLHRYERPEDVTLVTNKGITQYLRIGYFDVPMEEDNFRLQAYVSMTQRNERLFVMFRDWTSGDETSGDGRLIEPEPISGDLYLLDFNYAYNPDSAYNDRYLRQLAPKENWISVSIRAGERRYR
jgi:uncharacterized protein (DUF1684 family)